MSDITSNEHSTGAAKSAAPDSWARTLFRAQYRNTAAEAAGSLSWPLMVGVILLATLMTAFPFMYSRWTNTWNASDIAGYPGLGKVWLALADEEFSIRNGVVETGSKGPRTFEIEDWTILLGTMPREEPKSKTLVLSGTRLAVRGFTPDAITNGPALVLEGLDNAGLKKLSQNRTALTEFIRGSLFMANSAEVPSAFLTILALTLFQVTFFASILGLFLSLSALPIPGSLPQGARASGPLSSIKTAAAVTLGPAFLAALAGLVFPAWGTTLGWLGFTMVYAIRVVFIYMARFKNRKKPRKLFGNK